MTGYYHLILENKLSSDVTIAPFDNWESGVYKIGELSFSRLGEIFIGREKLIVLTSPSQGPPASHSQDSIFLYLPSSKVFLAETFF